MTRSLLPVSSTIASAGARDTWRTLPVSGKSAALIISISLHAAAALTFVHANAPRVNAAREQQSELAAPDLEVTDAPAPTFAAEPHEARHEQRTSQRASVPIHDILPGVHAVHDSDPAQAESASAPVTPPDTIAAPVAVAPRFAMTVGATTLASSERAPAGAGVGTASTAGDGAPVAERLVDTPARLLVGNSPSYTAEAEVAGVEADVPLEIVVDASGVVVTARVLAHVGYGLDEGALRSVRAYRFSPARRAGRSLAVRMRWLMRFQLR